MSQSFYIKQINDKLWSAAALLKLEALPLGIEGDLLEKILMTNNKPGTSFELFVDSGRKDQDTAEIHILLRRKGFELKTLSEALKQNTETVLHLLKYAGFRASLMSEKAAAAFDEKMKTRNNVILAIPGENIRNIKSFYAPGGYDAMKELDIPYLVSAISESEDAGMSVQIGTTMMFPEEKNAVIANIEWLNTLGTKESVRGIKVFNRIRLNSNLPVFFLTLSCWGDESSLNKVFNSLRTCGYSGLPVSPGVFYENSYLTEGDTLIQEFAAGRGHALHKNQTVSRGCDRLNYLTDLTEIKRMLQRAGKPEKIRGIKLNPHTSDAASIEKTPERFFSGNGIHLGTLVDSDQNFFLLENNLVKHAVISGMPGSGKTSLLFNILKELYDKKIPFIAVEPTKTEYRELIDAIPDLKVYTPGRTDVSPFMFNPFLPPENLTLEQYLPSLEEAFKAVFSMTTPLDVMFPEVLRNCYAKYGWSDLSTRDSMGVTHFGMHEFICEFRREAMLSDYEAESKQNLLGASTVRFQSLLNTNKYLFDTDKSISFEKMLQGYNVIELDAVKDEQKAVVMALIMLQLSLVISHNQKKDSRLKNVLLLDEAHVLLGGSDYSVKKNEADPAGKIRNLYLEMVKVNRAYGTGMIFSDQSLSILEDFVNISDVKITMHLESAEERAFITNNLNYSEEEYRGITSLKLGQFYISCEGIKHPVLVQAPDTKKMLSLSDDIDDETLASRMKVQHPCPFTVCTCKKGCDIEIRSEAEFIARKIYGEFDPAILKDKESLENFLNNSLRELIEEMTEDSDNEKKLSRCARLQFERMLSRKSDFQIKKEKQK